MSKQGHGSDIKIQTKSEGLIPQSMTIQAK